MDSSQIEKLTSHFIMYYSKFRVPRLRNGGCGVIGRRARLRI